MLAALVLTLEASVVRAAISSDVDENVAVVECFSGETIAADFLPQPGTADPAGIVVTARPTASKADPLAQVNQQSYAAVQLADRLAIAPISFAYQKTLPAPLRDAVHNVLYNFREPVVVVNFLLQHRIGKAGRAFARLAINSTAGLAGIFDVAKRKPFNIPFQRNGFANTLGFYGIKTGPYLYLPLIGSTTVRDLVGTIADRVFLSVAIGSPFTRPAYRIPVVVLGTVDDRLVNDAHIRDMREAEAGAYLSTRNAYLALRADEIAALHRRGP